MPDDPSGAAGPTPGLPPNPGPPPGVWMPTVAPPPASRPPARRRSGSGCGSSFLFLLGIVVVIGGIVGAAVIAVRWQQANDPDHQRAERIDDLRAVCDGHGIANVPAYRRGARDQLGARLEPTSTGSGDEADVVAFPLVPGAQVDPEAVINARVMACTTSTAVQHETCSFNDISKAPSFSGGGNVNAEWTTLTSTELRIVDVHSGAVLHRTSFDTPSECPDSLRVDDDGSYRQSLPVDQIRAQTEAQVALYHQGG